MSEITAERHLATDDTTIVIKIGGHELRRHHLVPIDPNSNVETLAYYVLHCLELINDNRMREEERKRSRWGI